MNKNTFNVKTSSTGAVTLEVSPENVQFVATPNGNYQFMDGDLVKVPDPGKDD